MSNRSRRDFLRILSTSAVGAGLAPSALARGRRVEILEPALGEPARPAAPSDRIGLATIGMGIIGFIDTDTALRVPGVELVAAADAYDGRLAHVKEVYGPGVATTRDYREILARPDVDAVIIAVPDHWHARMAIAAMEAGKDVYLEKPMVKELAEGPRVIEAQARTGRVLQVGSQYASDVIFGKIRELLAAGAIGEVNQVEAAYNRNSAIGAWQYSIPPNVTEREIAWEAFLGDAPRRPFDPVRFFRWRNYREYGTAVAGDLFVHLFTGIHKVLDAVGPTTIFSRGGLRFWKDGRDVPDVILGLFEYPETEHHAPFTLSLQSNFVDGSGGGSHFRFIGSEGVISVRGNG
ncbi:MAG TPA: Gfo/Idh/MocA family oxidoreductase, partial [Longimicrobiales bacterium]|nr:Gfo/Idh/MocA family oxidoreductase [Longimicrobiales bacterium]